MPWHKVVILHNDQARWSAAALMRPFIMGYHANDSSTARVSKSAFFGPNSLPSFWTEKYRL